MRLTLIMVSVSLLLAGCGGAAPPELVEINGSVTYQSEPVKDGVIKFIPTQSSGAPRRSAEIKEGVYSATGRGALGIGTYKVEILAYKGDPPDTKSYPVSDAASEKIQRKPRVQILPDKYNKSSEIEELKIQSGTGSIKKDFKLE